MLLSGVDQDVLLSYKLKLKKAIVFASRYVLSLTVYIQHLLYWTEEGLQIQLLQF